MAKKNNAKKKDGAKAAVKSATKLNKASKRAAKKEMKRVDRLQKKVDKVDKAIGRLMLKKKKLESKRDTGK